MNPARLCLGHSGFSIGFVVVDPAVVPEGCISNDVSNDQYDHDHDVDDRDLPPALLEAGQNPGLAGVAPIAELVLVVAPPAAVWIRTHGSSSSRRAPHRLVLVHEPTLRWRLAATRLHINAPHYYIKLHSLNHWGSPMIKNFTCLCR